MCYFDVKSAIERLMSRTGLSYRQIIVWHTELFAWTRHGSGLLSWIETSFRLFVKIVRVIGARVMWCTLRQRYVWLMYIFTSFCMFWHSVNKYMLRGCLPTLTSSYKCSAIIKVNMKVRRWAWSSRRVSIKAASAAIDDWGLMDGWSICHHVLWNLLCGMLTFRKAFFNSLYRPKYQKLLTRTQSKTIHVYY